MTHPVIWLAWAIGQLCLLPVAPARYLHDLVGYLYTKYVVGEHVEALRVERRGYRINWLVKWKPDAPAGAKRSVLIMPVLIGVGIFGVLGQPFVFVPWFDPAAVATEFTRLERALIELVGLQLVALPWPRVRDRHRWRAWWPDPDDQAGEVAEA